MKTLVRILLSLWFFVMTLLATADAQTANNSNPEEKQKALREQIAQSLVLSGAEADAFWNVYDRMEASITAVHEAHKAEMHGFKEMPEDLSESEIADFIRMKQNHESQMLELRKQYTEEFLSVIPASKVLELMKLLKEARNDFASERKIKSCQVE